MTRAREINNVITTIEDQEELLAYIDDNVQYFNTVNLSTAMHKIGKNNQRKNKRRVSLPGDIPVIEDPRQGCRSNHAYHVVHHVNATYRIACNIVRRASFVELHGSGSTDVCWPRQSTHYTPALAE
jgi:hypothetical protein